MKKVIREYTQTEIFQKDIAQLKRDVAELRTAFREFRLFMETKANKEYIDWKITEVKFILDTNLDALNKRLAKLTNPD